MESRYLHNFRLRALQRGYTCLSLCCVGTTKDGIKLYTVKAKDPLSGQIVVKTCTEYDFDYLLRARKDVLK